MIFRMLYEAISVKEKVGKKLLFDKCALVAKNIQQLHAQNVQKFKFHLRLLSSRSCLDLELRLTIAILGTK